MSEETGNLHVTLSGETETFVEGFTGALADAMRLGGASEAEITMAINATKVEFAQGLPKEEWVLRHTEDVGDTG